MTRLRGTRIVKFRLRVAEWADDEPAARRLNLTVASSDGSTSVITPRRFRTIVNMPSRGTVGEAVRCSLGETLTPFRPTSDVFVVSFVYGAGAGILCPEA